MQQKKRCWRLQAGYLQVRCCFMHLDILQKCYFLILYCIFFFVQLNCVMNGYYYFWPKFSADTSTNALREKKKTFECGTSDFLLIIVR